MIFERIFKVIKFLVVILAIGFFIWLAFKYFVPLGKLTFSYNFDNDSPFISRLRPPTRLADIQYEKKYAYQTMRGEPIIFDLKLPRPDFKKVKVTTTYKGNAPIFEIGALLENGWQTDIRTLQNDFIDNLNWSSIKNENYILYQKEKDYETVQDFLTNLPDEKSIATSHFDLKKEVVFENYLPKNQETEFDISLRGEHSIAVYVAGEPLFFRFLVQDANRHQGEDSIEMQVASSDGETVWQASLPDDGIKNSSGQLSDLREIIVKVPDLKSGVYTLFFKVNDDIFIRKITTSMQKFVFLDRLYLADEVNYSEDIKPITVWTNAKRLLVKTSHAEGIQTLDVGEQILEIKEPHEFYAFSVTSKNKPTSVTSPVRDVELQAEGVFAFSEQEFFNPRVKVLDWGTSIEESDLKYLLTNYEPPQKVGGWMEAEAVFDIQSLYRKKDRLVFFFFAPSMDMLESEIAIRQIRVELEK